MQVAEDERKLTHCQEQLQKAESQCRLLVKQLADLSDQASFDSTRCNHLEAEVIP